MIAVSEVAATEGLAVYHAGPAGAAICIFRMGLLCWYRPLGPVGAALLALTLTLLPMAVALAAEAPQVRIIATDPVGSEPLHQGEALSLRLAYRSENPLRFQIDGFAGGERRTDVETGTVPVYPPGQGEAIVWLRLRNGGFLDEVRVRVMDAQWQVLTVVVQPGPFFWESRPGAAPRTSAPWVAELNQAQAAMARASAAAAAAEAEGGFDGWGLLVILMGWSVPGYLALQVYMVARWRGGWRKAALAPLALMIPVGAYTLFALVAGSNLWPLVLLFVSPFAFLFLAALWLLRQLRAPSRKPEKPAGA